MSEFQPSGKIIFMSLPERPFFEAPAMRLRTRAFGLYRAFLEKKCPTSCTLLAHRLNGAPYFFMSGIGTRLNVFSAIYGSMMDAILDAISWFGSWMRRHYFSFSSCHVCRISLIFVVSVIVADRALVASTFMTISEKIEIRNGRRPKNRIPFLRSHRSFHGCCHVWLDT